MAAGGGRCQAVVAAVEQVFTIIGDNSKKKRQQQTHLSFQKRGVKMMSTENISKRPINMRTEHIHFAKTGKSFHDMVGPISVPRVGPTLLNVEMVIVMAFVISTPVRQIDEGTRLDAHLPSH